MKTETKSADALARELAEEAADRCAFVSRTHKEFARAEAMAAVILRDAKLRELCAVAEALREIEEFLEHTACCPARQNEEWPGIGHCNCGLTEFRIKREQALAALDGGGK